MREERGSFLSDVNAKEIAEDAKHEFIIPDGVKADIMSAKSREAQNQSLYDHLLEDTTVEGVRKLCLIMTRKQGYTKMIAFGEKLLKKLKTSVDSHMVGVMHMHANHSSQLGHGRMMG